MITVNGWCAGGKGGGGWVSVQSMGEMGKAVGVLAGAVNSTPEMRLFV